MAFYIVNQLRGWAGALQAEEAKPGVAEAKGKEAYGLAHNLGLGLSCQIISLALARPLTLEPAPPVRQVARASSPC